jgi:hypothetical protein
MQFFWFPISASACIMSDGVYENLPFCVTSCDVIFGMLVDSYRLMCAIGFYSVGSVFESTGPTSVLVSKKKKKKKNYNPVPCCTLR